MHSHCGKCSQCVDRRLNALAAGLTADEDPAEMYASDVVTGPRENTELTMIERYIGTALEIDHISSAAAFLVRFPEAARALRHVQMSSEAAAEKVFDLYRRHARDICQTLAELVKNDAEALVHRRHPPNCLLSVAVGHDSTHRFNAQGVATSGARGQTNAVGKPMADSDTFSVRFDGKECELGNTREFALFARLIRSPGIYLSTQTLSDDVWGSEGAQKNTIQRTISNLRRKLSKQGMRIAIDGRNKGHYKINYSDLE